MNMNLKYGPRTRDRASGFQFYDADRRAPAEKWLEKYLGVVVLSCGRMAGSTCYYIEGEEGNENFNQAVELAGDLVERFEEVRSFVKPVPKELWSERSAELRRGIKNARNNSGPVLVYEGCSSTAAKEQDMSPCYKYIGSLQMFAKHIQNTHQQDWLRYKISLHTNKPNTTPYTTVDQEEPTVYSWRNNPDLKDNFKKVES